MVLFLLSIILWFLESLWRAHWVANPGDNHRFANIIYHSIRSGNRTVVSGFHSLQRMYLSLILIYKFIKDVNIYIYLDPCIFNSSHPSCVFIYVYRAHYNNNNIYFVWIFSELNWKHETQNDGSHLVEHTNMLGSIRPRHYRHHQHYHHRRRGGSIIALDRIDVIRQYHCAETSHSTNDQLSLNN